MRTVAGVAAAWLPLISLALACGGPSAPAASADAAPDEAAAPAGAEGDTETKAEASAADKRSTSAPASDEDVTAILQLVVDDPELDNHLHLGTAGRFPLQMSGERLPSGLKLVKATEPVKIVDAPKSKKDAVLVITEIDVQGDKATVRYRYDIENIRATVTLAKSGGAGGRWELKNSRLVEH
jgi:hypothetical protein